MVSPVGESGVSCRSCGIDLQARSRFCDVCGSPVCSPAAVGEHKHVTVLFADVVGSMKLAAALDSERLREVMNELFNRSAAVVQRYQGTLDKFTGDGLMAIFGAPIALEDHALRACIAALEIQSVVGRLADEVLRLDGLSLKLRVGLNSGEVVVGEIGSGPGGYTAVGRAVGMAQRMEASAPAGGVLCSCSTAELVEHSARLGPVEKVIVKGANEPVPARGLIAVEAGRMVGRNEGLMLGRDSELSQLHAAVDTEGGGRLISVVGAPGVGKSRLISEFSAQVANRRVDVAVARCDAHATPIAFRALARLLRAMFGVDGVGDEQAREHVVAQAPMLSSPESADARILFEAMGLTESASPPLQVGADGRRNRLVEIMSQVARGRSRQALFVLEDTHWVDAASDAVLADFANAIFGTAVTFVITHRPEFYGALQRSPTITLSMQPLEDAVTVELTGYLLGRDRSLVGLAPRIAQVAAGNPYFVEEVVRDLAGRGVLAGSRGGYRLLGDADDIGVPVTVQAVLAARIDRLPAAAKSVLNAAAVVGGRFDEETLAVLVPGALSNELAELVATELIDQTEFVPRQRYCFRHPLVRTVAYESQLSVTRTLAHRRVAAAIEARDPGAQDENAALIASHLEAAGEIELACEWHLRAADWLRPRDLLAARAQWESAMHAADRLPGDDHNTVALRIATRTMLISTELFVGTDPDNDQRFLELRDLTARADDTRSLAIAMAGRIMAFTINGTRVPEGTVLAVELDEIVDTLDGVPAAELEILLTALASTRLMNCQFDAALQVINRSIALPQEQPSLDRAVAFALRGLAEVCLGRHPQGIDDLHTATALARLMPPVSFSSILIYWGMVVGMGLHLPDDLVGEMREALRRAESFGDRFGIIGAQWAYGCVLLRADAASRDEAVGVLEVVSHRIKTHGLLTFALASIESDLATAAASRGRRDEAIDQLRDLVSLHMRDGSLILIGCSAEALVAFLSERGSPADLDEAARLIENWRVRRHGAPAMDLWWKKSRAVLAEAQGDAQRYAALAQEYLIACEELDARGRVAEARRMVASSAGGNRA